MLSPCFGIDATLCFPYGANFSWLLKKHFQRGIQPPSSTMWQSSMSFNNMYFTLLWGKKSLFFWGLHCPAAVCYATDSGWGFWPHSVLFWSREKGHLRWERHDPFKRINIPLTAECTEFIQRCSPSSVRPFIHQICPSTFYASGFLPHSRALALSKNKALPTRNLHAK